MPGHIVAIKRFIGTISFLLPFGLWVSNQIAKFVKQLQTPSHAGSGPILMI